MRWMIINRMNPCKFTIAHMRKGLNIPIPWWDLQSISFAATKAQRRFATERDAKLEATTDMGELGGFETEGCFPCADLD